MIPLLPCPFCRNANPDQWADRYGGMHLFKIACPCGARMGGSGRTADEAKANAVADWNTRTPAVEQAPADPTPSPRDPRVDPRAGDIVRVGVTSYEVVGTDSTRVLYRYTSSQIECAADGWRNAVSGAAVLHTAPDPTPADDRWRVALQSLAHADHHGDPEGCAEAVRWELEKERIEALAEADRYRLALESLTPGGSEYSRDAEACVRFVREAFATPVRVIARFKQERDEARLTAANEEALAKVAIRQRQEALSAAAQLREALREVLALFTVTVSGGTGGAEYRGGWVEVEKVARWRAIAGAKS
jgi:hypothetical protein